MRTPAILRSITIASFLFAGTAYATTQSAAQAVLDSFGRSITYNVTVEIDEGVAIIRGSVDAYHDAIKIKNQISQLDGVERVIDRLRRPGIHQ